MKKLLILALVFSMTSAASAALSLGGATEVTPGGSVTVTVSSTDTSNWMGYIGFNDTVIPGVTVTGSFFIICLTVIFAIR